MSKRTPVVEWYVVEDNADWERLCAPLRLGNGSGLEMAAHGRLYAQRFLGGVAVILLLLVSAGGWWWHTAQAGSQPIAAELRATGQRELRAVAPSATPLVTSFANFALQPQSSIATAPPRRNGPTIVEQLADRQAVAEHQATMAGQGQVAQGYSGLHAAVLTEETVAHVLEAVQTFEVQGDGAGVPVAEQAVTRVVTMAKSGPYRQTLFYRRTAEGWQQTSPDAAFWGAERSLETPYFVFRFRQNDAPAVIAVAPQIEALYTTLQSNFGLPVPFGAEKLAIEVNMTQPSEYAATWFGAPDRISVPSPMLYTAPIELTDAELLAQSIALPLLAQVLTQASEQHAIGSSWRPLLDGLRLWQVWDLDLPLAVWREDVVTWVYGGLTATRPGQAVVLPERYPALCAAHKLWLPSPTQINIPLLCGELVWEDLLLSP